MQAIPSSKYVINRGPEYNMAHSFDERTRTFMPSRESIMMRTNRLNSGKSSPDGALAPVHETATFADDGASPNQPAHGANYGGTLRTTPAVPQVVPVANAV